MLYHPNSMLFVPHKLKAHWVQGQDHQERDATGLRARNGTQQPHAVLTLVWVLSPSFLPSSPIPDGTFKLCFLYRDIKIGVSKALTSFL